jgi:putative transposase
MRYPASEKAGNHSARRAVAPAGAKQTLDKLGIPRPTFYRWYDRFLTHGVEGLEDLHSAPSRVWNRIPDDIRDRIIDIALDQPDLSPRELAVRSPTQKAILCQKLRSTACSRPMI